MAHKVEFDENIRAVRVTHYGVCDLTDLTQAREKAVVMLQEHRVASILVDTTAIKNTPSTITSFEFSSTHFSTGQNKLFTQVYSGNLQKLGQKWNFHVLQTFSKSIWIQNQQDF
jgi:hypothetical protein